MSTAAPRTAPAPAPVSSWVVPWLVAGLIWGCSFAFIQVGLRALTPVQVAFWRLALGAVTLLLISLVMRVGLPRSRRMWAHLVVVAVLLNAAPGLLFAIGEQHVSSVIAGIINAMTPLATLAVILAAYPEERPTARRVLGLLTGFAGVAVVVGVWRGLGTGEWTGIAACVGAITCYGLALPYSRRYLTASGERPLGMVTGQVVLSAVIMLPVLLLTGVRPVGEVTPTVLWCMVALGTLGSGVAYALNFHVIAVAGPSTASTVTYLTPLVATVVGAAFLDEHLSWNEPVGAAIVLAGVALGQAGTGRRPQPPPVPSVAPPEPDLSSRP